VTKFGALLNTKESSLKVDVGTICRTTINPVLCGLHSFLCSLALLFTCLFLCMVVSVCLMFDTLLSLLAHQLRIL
jgi:hypothetical protein